MPTHGDARAARRRASRVPHGERLEALAAVLCRADAATGISGAARLRHGARMVGRGRKLLAEAGGPALCDRHVLKRSRRVVRGGFPGRGPRADRGAGGTTSRSGAAGSSISRASIRSICRGTTRCSSRTRTGSSWSSCTCRNRRAPAFFVAPAGVCPESDRRVPVPSYNRGAAAKSRREMSLTQTLSHHWERAQQRRGLRQGEDSEKILKTEKSTLSP